MAPTAHTQVKSKKQLYMVVGLGVGLVVILAIQLPRLLGGGTEATPPTTTETVPTAPGTTNGGTGAVPVSGSATLGGVKLVPGVVSKPGEGQLASFSLFDRRDPFVQVVKETGATGSQDGEPVGVKVSGGGGAGASASGASGAAGATGGNTGGSGSVSNPTGLTTATIWVNGEEQSVDVKKRFPKTDPTFVLVGLKPKVAQIGVAGGAFTGGGTIPLKMGQTLTLVNTATGARYTLRLLYTGAQPEQVQQFTTQAQN